MNPDAGDTRNRKSPDLANVRAKLGFLRASGRRASRIACGETKRYIGEEKRMKFFRVLAILAATTAAAPALAQTYPAKPIRIVVSTSAGGVTDLCARVLGHYITTKTGQPVV